MASQRGVAAGAVLACWTVAALAWPSGARADPSPLETTVTVEVVLSDADDAAAPVPADVAAQIASVGGRVVGAESGSVLLVDVPAAHVDDLDAAGVEVRDPVHMNVVLRGSTTAAPAYGPTPGDSAAAMGATLWHAAGIDGQGVRIGVIDYFGMSFWNEAEMGPSPVATGHAFCRAEGSDCLASFATSTTDSGARRHGPAVVEIIKDVAPAAEIFIASAETYSDYIQVIDWFAANQVTIVSRSLGTLIDGPGDGRGATDQLADYAASRQMVWFNAAGNEAAGGYWRGTGSDRSNGYVVFGRSAGTPTDEMAVTGCTIAALRWNDWDTPASARSDYDLELYERSADETTLLVARSGTADQHGGAAPLEQVTPTCPTIGRKLFLKVRYVGGGTADDDVVEILDYDSGLQFRQAPYSAALPVSDSKNPSVIAVGAIDPVGGTAIGAYSSRGPTNDGRTKPDLVAPAGVRSSVYGVFSGTSASAPAAAGVAALLLQARLALPGAPLAAVARAAVAPLGSPVPNSTFGAGVVHLGAPPTPATGWPTTTYAPLAEPLRIVDTRPTSAVGPAALTGRRAPGSLLDVPVEALLGRAAGSVAAVVVNLTVVDAAEPGWSQVVPTARAAIGAYSNLNIDAGGQTRSNLTIVPVGAQGSISIYVGSGGDTLVDVLGTFGPVAGAVAGGRFEPVQPVRALDTRPASRVGAAGSGPDGTVRRGESVCVDAAALGIPADGTVAALAMTVTATAVTATGYVQAVPTGGAVAMTSTLNVTRGSTVANSTIVPLGGPCGGSVRSVSLYLDSGSFDAHAHLIADVTGFVTGDAAAVSPLGKFVPVVPGRVLDTRPAPLATGSVITVPIGGAAGPAPPVPVGASAVAANITATNTRGWGYLSAWRALDVRPPTSTLNWSVPGATVATATLLEVSAAGGLALASETPSSPISADHLVDVFGYFT